MMKLPAQDCEFPPQQNIDIKVLSRYSNQRKRFDIILHHLFKDFEHMLERTASSVLA